VALGVFAELALPAIHAVEQRLVVAGELEAQVGAVGGEFDAALLARDTERLEYGGSVTIRARGGAGGRSGRGLLTSLV
jgi:hypothetical protein